MVVSTETGGRGSAAAAVSTETLPKTVKKGNLNKGHLGLTSASNRRGWDLQLHYLLGVFPNTANTRHIKTNTELWGSQSLWSNYKTAEGLSYTQKCSFLSGGSKGINVVSFHAYI